MRDTLPHSTPSAAPAEKLLCTSREAAFTLSISERKLWELTNRGIIRCVRIGRAVRYARTELARFAEQETTTA